MAHNSGRKGADRPKSSGGHMEGRGRLPEPARLVETLAEGPLVPYLGGGVSDVQRETPFGKAAAIRLKPFPAGKKISLVSYIQ